MSDTPHSLLDRLRAQPSTDSWQRFVHLYTPLIRAWLRRHHVSEHDTEDLLQEVLSAVVKDIPRFQHSQRAGAFRSWLRTITIHRLKHFWRSARARPATTGLIETLEQLEDPQSELSRLWDDEHDQHVTRQLLEMIATEFEPTTWQAFRRVAFDGIKASVAANELGISVNAVYIAHSRVLARLREEGKGLIE